jgi:hypothetical protein
VVASTFDADNMDAPATSSPGPGGDALKSLASGIQFNGGGVGG